MFSESWWATTSMTEVEEIHPFFIPLTIINIDLKHASVVLNIWFAY